MRKVLIYEELLGQMTQKSLDCLAAFVLWHLKLPLQIGVQGDCTMLHGCSYARGQGGHILEALLKPFFTLL